MAVPKTYGDGDHTVVVAQIVAVCKSDALELTIYTSTVGILRWKFAATANRDTYYTGLIAAMNA